MPDDIVYVDIEKTIVGARVEQESRSFRNSENGLFNKEGTEHDKEMK